MAGFEIPSVADLSSIVSDFLKSDDGREAVKESGFGVIGDRKRSEVVTEYEKIAQQFLRDVQIAYGSVLTRDKRSNMGMSLFSTSVFRGMEDYKTMVSGAKNEVVIVITVPSDLLFRPSLEMYEYGHRNHVEDFMAGKRRRQTIVSKSYRRGTERYTGEGINDIFALVTHGYQRIRAHGLRGLWADNPDGSDKITYALPQRRGTPFVPGVVSNYESMYPGLHIIYPPEWG